MGASDLSQARNNCFQTQRHQFFRVFVGNYKKHFLNLVFRNQLLYYKKHFLNVVFRNQLLYFHRNLQQSLPIKPFTGNILEIMSFRAEFSGCVFGLHDWVARLGCAIGLRERTSTSFPHRTNAGAACSAPAPCIMHNNCFKRAFPGRATEPCSPGKARSKTSHLFIRPVIHDRHDRNAHERNCAYIKR